MKPYKQLNKLLNFELTNNIRNIDKDVNYNLDNLIWHKNLKKLDAILYVSLMQNVEYQIVSFYS